MDGISNQPYTPDLRGFIEYLDKEHPEEIIRITKEVDPKYGVSGILHRLEKEGHFKAVIFENVKGSEYRWSPICMAASRGCAMPSAWRKVTKKPS